MVKRVVGFLMGVIMGLFKKDEQENLLIESYKAQIHYLQHLVEQMRLEREAERAEYKRAMDVLLVKQELPIIGQGVQTMNNMSPAQMLAYMDTEVTESK